MSRSPRSSNGPSTSVTGTPPENAGETGPQQRETVVEMPSVGDEPVCQTGRMNVIHDTGKRGMQQWFTTGEGDNDIPEALPHLGKYSADKIR